MQVKTTRRCHDIIRVHRLLLMKNDNYKVSEDIEKLELSHAVFQNVKW